MNTLRKRRRGASLAELQAALLVVSIVSVPALGVGIAVTRAAGEAQVTAAVQGDLDAALTRVGGLFRQATSLETNGPAVRLRDADGARHELSLRDGRLWERVGDAEPVPLADGVVTWEVHHGDTETRRRPPEQNATKVVPPGTSAIGQIRLILSRGGVSRAGYLEVHLRNLKSANPDSSGAATPPKGQTGQLPRVQ